MTVNELTFFTVTGAWEDVESPLPGGTTNADQILNPSGLVTFYPRVPVGYVAYVDNLDQVITNPGVGADTALALAPIVARILNGVLSTIDTTDAVGVKLVANTAVLNFGGDLIYDVQFSHVIYANAVQSFQNFSFVAPTTAVTMSLTDPDLLRGQYKGPHG